MSVSGALRIANWIDARLGFRARYVCAMIVGKLARRGAELPRYRNHEGVTFFHLALGDHIQRQIALYGYYERSYLEFLARLFQGLGTKTFVDIGANVGNHALFFARRGLEVACFEPSPRALADLRRNRDGNAFARIRLYEIGLGDVAGTLAFDDEFDGNLGAGRFAEGGKLVLPVRRFDEVGLQFDGAATAVKIDVEGMELNVLRGMSETLRVQRPIVVFEFFGSEARFAELRTIMESYSLFELRSRLDHGIAWWRRLVSAATDGELVRCHPVHAAETRTYSMMLGIPDERVASLKRIAPRAFLPTSSG